MHLDNSSPEARLLVDPVLIREEGGPGLRIFGPQRDQQVVGPIPTTSSTKSRTYRFPGSTKAADNMVFEWLAGVWSARSGSTIFQTTAFRIICFKVARCRLTVAGRFPAGGRCVRRLSASQKLPQGAFFNGMVRRAPMSFAGPAVPARFRYSTAHGLSARAAPGSGSRSFLRRSG